MAATVRAVVACFGNVLRGDDGVGPAVAHVLSGQLTRPDVLVLEVGIGGIHLVQQLLDGVQLLVVVDAVDLGRPAGTVLVQRPQVADVRPLPVAQRHDQLADMHLASPARALTVALGLGVLPPATFLVGVQSTDTEQPRIGLSAPAQQAVPIAVQEVRRLLSAHLPEPS